MEDITYLGQNEAIAVDEELMGPLGFSVDQLMELAGQACAASVAAEYSLATHNRVLVCAGPGNNGGDGLVAARHLTHYGYKVEICYPKRTAKPLYEGLVTQCTALGIPFIEPDALQGAPLSAKYDVVLDAMFGFSFKGTPRPPFDAILAQLKPAASPPPVVSVDIPSGWDVEEGDVNNSGFAPEMLISLTAPKKCAKSFQGKYHYLGGRFVPPAIREKYSLKLPEYPGTAVIVKIQAEAPKAADMRISYEAGALDEADAAADPIDQFDDWFKTAVEHGGCVEPNTMAVASVSADGAPSVRYVLLKGYDERGFVFYTNYNSRKGRELIESGNAAMTMLWEGLQRSVRVEGTIEKVPESESTEYYHSRPRGSQIGAWVSEQSTVIDGRKVLEERDAMYKAKYADESLPVPKPPHWGGFLIRPSVVEFWQGRPSRLHDRLVYRRSKEGVWGMERLSP